MKEIGLSSTILIVDDNPINVRLLSQALKGLGNFLFALSGPDALRIIQGQIVDLVLLDINMPGMSGYDICAAILKISDDIPIVFVTSYQDSKEEIKALQSGGMDFIQKPFNPLVIRARVTAYLRAKKQADKLRNLLHLDPLTEISNRRYLDEQCLKAWNMCRIQEQPLSLLMIDIDYFKRYNDHYGHPGGDRCLQRVAKTIRDTVRRPSSVVARYGGEEFSVLLPRCCEDEASLIAKRICEEVRQLCEPHEESDASPFVTVSIGVAMKMPAQITKENDLESGPNPGFRIAAQLFAAADVGLYQAKELGRNRSCISNS